MFNLIELGYYNDMRFFRVNGKVVQFGVHALKDMNRNIYSYVDHDPPKSGYFRFSKSQLT